MNLLIPSIFLSVFGLFNLFGLNQDLFLKQLIYILLSFFIYFLIKKIKRHFFQINNKLLFYLALFLLIFTFILGVEVKGSKRWLDFYIFRFQASEFLKPIFILFLSEYFQTKNIFKNNLDLLIKSFIFFIIPFIIIFKQPDLANAITFLIIYFVILFFSQIPKKYIIYFFSILLLILPFGWFLLKDYQKIRVLSFIEPDINIQGSSYNVLQSIITIGSGQFFGRGLGLGTQSRLYFLPENTTDFAFASLVEQFGFFGGFFVIIFYFTIIYHIAKNAMKFYFEKTEEGKSKFLFSIGLLSYVSFQVFVNIGMNMGLLPVAGVALPFISYGGSSVMALLIGFALLPI